MDYGNRWMATRVTLSGGFWFAETQGLERTVPTQGWRADAAMMFS